MLLLLLLLLVLLRGSKPTAGEHEKTYRRNDIYKPRRTNGVQQYSRHLALGNIAQVVSQGCMQDELVCCNSKHDFYFRPDNGVKTETRLCWGKGGSGDLCC